MTAARLRTVALVAIPVFAIGGFVLDLASPLGISDWVYYFIPLLLSVYVGGRLLPILLAAVFSLLMLAGFFLSPPGIDPHLAMFSRLMGVSVLWVMAFVIWQRKRADEEVRQLSLAIEHSPVSIIITDKAGNIEYVNPKFTEVSGFTKPSKANEAAFAAAVDEGAAVSSRLLSALETNAPPRSREEEAAGAKARNAARFGKEGLTA